MPDAEFWDRAVRVTALRDFSGRGTPQSAAIFASERGANDGRFEGVSGSRLVRARAVRARMSAKSYLRWPLVNGLRA